MKLLFVTCGLRFILDPRDAQFDGLADFYAYYRCGSGHFTGQILMVFGDTVGELARVRLTRLQQRLGRITVINTIDFGRIQPVDDADLDYRGSAARRASFAWLLARRLGRSCQGAACHSPSPNSSFVLHHEHVIGLLVVIGCLLSRSMVRLGLGSLPLRLALLVLSTGNARRCCHIDHDLLGGRGQRGSADRWLDRHLIGIVNDDLFCVLTDHDRIV